MLLSFTKRFFNLFVSFVSPGARILFPIRIIRFSRGKGIISNKDYSIALQRLGGTAWFYLFIYLFNLFIFFKIFLFSFRRSVKKLINICNCLNLHRSVFRIIFLWTASVRCLEFMFGVYEFLKLVKYISLLKSIDVVERRCKRKYVLHLSLLQFWNTSTFDSQDAKAFFSGIEASFPTCFCNSNRSFDSGNGASDPDMKLQFWIVLNDKIL